MTGIPLHVELLDLAQFFESCARGGVAFDSEGAHSFAEEIADMATRAKALETGAPDGAVIAGPADIAAVGHDLSRALGAVADFFVNHRDDKLMLTAKMRAELGALLRDQQERARQLEHDFERWRRYLAEADARIAELSGADEQAVLAREMLVLEGLRAGKIIDISGARRREHAALGRGYIGPLGDAS